MQLNYLAILVATAAQFALGFVWYGPLFSKLWGKIHGFDKLPKETQQKMMKMMGPLYGVQALVTLITTVVLAIFLAYQPTWNAYAMAGFFWIGFVVPTQVSGVLFGGTKPEWVVTKIAVMAGGSLVFLEAATAILHLWK
jgi:hypothetical protein